MRRPTAPGRALGLPGAFTIFGSQSKSLRDYTAQCLPTRSQWPARDTGSLSQCGTIVAMCRADHADQAMDMSTFGNSG